MLIKGNFAQLDGLAQQIVSTVERVQTDMDQWQRTAGATSQDWMDGAGEQFGEISRAWQQVSTAQQTMLQTLREGVAKSNAELQQALGSATARVSSTSI